MTKILNEQTLNPEEKNPITNALSIAHFKESTKLALREVTNPEVSRFESWTDEQLKELLVEYNVEIRGSSYASHESLVKICDEVFPQHFEIPEHGETTTTEDWIVKDDAVHTIQKFYIRKKSQQKYAEYDTEECLQNNSGGRDEHLFGEQTLRHDSMIKKINNKDLAEEEIEVEWIKPSWKIAKRYEAASHPHHSGEQMKRYNWKKTTLGRHCTYSGCGEQLDLWNEGKTSEFAQFGSGITNYFKFSKWCCWIMLLLSIIHLPIAIINTMGAPNQYNSIGVPMTTFGNLGSADEITQVTIPGCNQTDYQQDECTVIKDNLALFYACLDMFSTVLVIMGWKWLKIFEKGEAMHLNRSTVTASDYTIRIKNIPKDTNEAELAVHFAKISEGPVAEVHLAYENAKEIKEYFIRGKLMQKRFNVVQKIRYEKTKEKNLGPKAVKKRRLRKLLKERDKLTKAIRLKDAEREESVHPFPKPIQAFVTFQKERGYVNAMSAYQLYWFRAYSCFYPQKLKFKGKTLKVCQAPESSTIIWENLECSNKSRNLRKTLTTGIATLAILLSVVFTFLARDFKSRALENTSQDCPYGFHELSKKKQFEIIKYDTGLSHCYCSRLSGSEQAQEDLCRDYLQSKMQSMLMSYGAGFMVVFMNSFFTWLMDKAGSFERHQSLDEMETSVMVRVFLLKFLNTGCLVLLYNQKWLQNLVGVRFQDEPDFGVTWYETGGLSLIIVMCMNIISPHVSPLVNYMKHRKKIAKIEKHLTKSQETDDKFRIWYSQDDLNQQYLGPHFGLKHRYTQNLVNFYVCWMFSTAMPLMLLIGTVSFYVSFWVDKFLFCNFYRIPYMYSDKMGKKSTKLIGFSIILHLVMSIWMMGNKKIFRSESYGDKINILGFRIDKLAPLNQIHLLPLEMLLAFVIVYIVISQVSGSWGHQLKKIVKCLTCKTGIAKGKLVSQMNTVQVDYTSARDRGIIKGLASYNIFQNPKYQEAFAVSPEFAHIHSHLNSIRGLNTKDGNIEVGLGSHDSDDDYSDESSCGSENRSL